MDYVVFTQAERTLCREKALPTINKVTDLLLRGGAMGYLDMKHLLHKSSEEDSNISKDKRRVNPVALKVVLEKCGVLLSSDEYKWIRTAYSDEGGFLVDEFLDLVRPSRKLSEHEVATLQGICADVSSGSCMILLEDTLHSLEDALLSGNVASGVAAGDSLIASALLEIQVVFTPLRYPKCLVPCQDIVEVLAALLLNMPDIRVRLLESIANVRLKSAPSACENNELVLPSKSRSTLRFERGYDYYTDRDNRDEWIRGREEAPARPMYMRHLPGYQGHMPTYRSKIGRSFHPIEESMPELSRPKRPLDPLLPDRYGPGVELKGNRMSRHNFRLA